MLITRLGTASILETLKLNRLTEMTRVKIKFISFFFIIFLMKRVKN